MAEAEAKEIKAVAMTEEEILNKVIKSLGLTVEFHKDIIEPFFEEVKFFLLGAGVPEKVVLSSASVGVLIRGVSDLWNYGTGNASLSPYFKERVIQLTTNNIVVEEAADNG